MTQVSAQLDKKLFPGIREILNSDWDPIGGCPADEYDTYAQRVCSMLLSNNSDAGELSAYLSIVEQNEIGTSPSNKSHEYDEGLRKVAEKLVVRYNTLLSSHDLK